MRVDQVDMFIVLGVDQEAFNGGSQNIKLVKGRETQGRLFRRHDKLVFRAGNRIEWYDDDDTAVTVRIED